MLDAADLFLKKVSLGKTWFTRADGACACLPIRPGGLDESGGESRDSCDVISVAAAKLLTGETIKDTTGAGDAFCGAFVHALASGLSLPACLQRASVAGTVGCLAVGARTSVPGTYWGFPKSRHAVYCPSLSALRP